MPETPEDAGLYRFLVAGEKVEIGDEIVEDGGGGWRLLDVQYAGEPVTLTWRSVRRLAHDASAQAAEITALRAERDALREYIATAPAADALTALRARVAGLEGALDQIDQPWFPTREAIEEIRAIARAAPYPPSAAQEARDAE